MTGVTPLRTFQPEASERQLEGIAKAQAEGRYLRPADESASLRASEAPPMVAEGKTVTQKQQKRRASSASPGLASPRLAHGI